MSSTLFSKEALGKAVEETKKEVKKANQIMIPAGFNILQFSSIELTMSNKDLKQKDKPQHPMIVIGVIKGDDKEEKYREILQNYVIHEGGLQTKAGVNLNLFILLTFSSVVLGQTITELDENDPLGDLVEKMKKGLNTKFRGVVGWEKKLNQDMTKEVINATLESFSLNVSLRRARPINDTSLSETTVKQADCVANLSPRDRAILAGTVIPDEFKSHKPSATPSADDVFGAPAVTDAPGGEGGVKGLPF